MKALLVFAFVFTTSAAYAGQLNIDVVPGRGGASYLQFTEANGKITAVGSGPFLKANNQTYVEEMADGSLKGFVLGTPFNLLCSDTECVDKGSTEVQITITKVGSGSGLTTIYDGSIQYHPVHATVTETEIAVSADGTFNAGKRKNDTFSGQGAFSRVRFGFFDVRLAASGGFSINDPRLFILTVLNTFSGGR